MDFYGYLAFGVFDTPSPSVAVSPNTDVATAFAFPLHLLHIFMVSCSRRPRTSLSTSGSFTRVLKYTRKILKVAQSQLVSAQR